MRLVLALAAAAALLTGFATVAKADYIQCPLQQARRTITDQLPNGWWTTPIVDRLSDTKVRDIGGKPALICYYGASGSVQREAPRRQVCQAVRGGFNCERRPGPGGGGQPGRPQTYSTGGIDVPQTFMFDLDRGAVARQGADFWFQAETRALLYLVPQNGAQIGVGDRSARGYDGCSRARMTRNRVSLSDLPVGSYICVRTNEGRVSQFRVNALTQRSPKTLSIGYTTWR